MTTDTSHDESTSERTISQTEWLYLVRDHAKQEQTKLLLEDTIQVQKTVIASLQASRVRAAEDRAQDAWLLAREKEDAAGLRKELADMTAVAQELDASSKRMQERAETAERRLQQQSNGEDDEVIAGLRELLTQERNTVCQRDQQLKDACAKAEELRGRAQVAEAEASGLRNKLKRAEEQAASNTAAAAGYREANGEMDRIMRQQEDRIRHLERVIDGLRAEVSHSTVEAPDAVA